jgi:hypothetical protein
MNSGRKVGFGAGAARKWGRASVTLVVAIASLGVGALSGCETTDAKVEISPREVGAGNLAGMTTAELQERRSVVVKRYAEIQRDVELKSGLPMGVAMKDERALLGELYREAHEIDRELVRRWSRGDPDVTIQHMRASFR